MTLTAAQKYADPAVVRFWQMLARRGLQQVEAELVRRYLPAPGPLLDLGCGAGRAGLALTETGYRVTGLDLSLPMLHAGRSLSAGAKLGGANLLALPLADASFAGAFMFFGALQHIDGRRRRRLALAEMARVVRPGGRLLLGLDNLAPALTLYGYWLREKIAWEQGRRGAGEKNPINSTNPINSPNSPHSATDSALWQRRGNPLVWHGRGVLRSLRWRSWPGLVDRYRRGYGSPAGPQPGDVNVAQFSQPATPGKTYYHLYQPGELIADAAAAGWTLLGWHAGSEIIEQKKYPVSIRGLDKQLFFSFAKQV